ncbi:MAG TPA: exo-alpha-sialidase, partial [Thermoplasmata archaeon]|nr:exo-alpha-sialidase [Thermoplasmata archaeon]
MAKGKVAVWVGTRKGAYGLTSDAKRRKWTVKGPYHAGGDVFDVVADPRDPKYVYALVNSGWFGPRVFRSSNGGVKWTEVAPPMMALLKDRAKNEMGGSEAGPIVNLWHLTPGPENEPGSLFLGADPGMLFRSDDRGASWAPLNGLNEHSTRPKWNPGAGGMCLHTILIDPTRPKRMYAGISAAGVFRSDD